MRDPAISNSNRREKFFAASLLLVFLVIYYNSVVVRGNSFMTNVNRTYYAGLYHYSGTTNDEPHKLATGDPAAANQTVLPSAYLENHYLKSLQLPLWNPYSGLGRPYNADMHSYTFFLPIYLFKFFPSLVIYDLFLLLRLFISGFFLFLLLRLYKCQFWIAIAGACFFMFNSHFYTFIDMDHLNVTMFLSPMVYFLTKYIYSINKRYLIGFILCSAGSFYGGNPNEFILIHLFITLYFIFLTFMQSRLDFAKKLNFLLSYSGSLGLSILLSAVKLIPFIEFWNNSVSGRTGLVGTTDFLPLKEFLVWVLSPNQITYDINYIGYLILSLMFYSLINLVRKKWGLREKIVAFHFILLFMVVSKINGAPYINWIGVLPGLNNINYVKYCSLIYYIISVISSFSLIYLAENIKKPRDKVIRLFMFLSCCILPHLISRSVMREPLFQSAENGKSLLYVFIFFILIGLFLVIIKKSYKNRVMTSCAVVILAFLVVFELRLNNQQYYGERFKMNDMAPYTQFLLEQKKPYRSIGIDGTLMPNHNLVYPIPTVDRIFAMRVDRATVLLSQLISNKFHSGATQYIHKNEILNNPYFDLLNTKYYISESIMDSIVLNPEYANFNKVKALLNNPSMQYTDCGNSYYYEHLGWQQLADSSIDIPINLPYGEVYLRSTALAFNFDWRKRDPENRLLLIISVKQENAEDIVYKREFNAQGKENQDFFNLSVNLSKYAGQDVVINFTLRNPGAKKTDDRKFFFGDLRVTYNKTKKISPGNRDNEEALDSKDFETVPYEDVFSHHAIIYRNNKALERGFILYNVKRIWHMSEAIAILKKEPLVYKNTALIEGDLPNNMNIGKVGQSKVSFLDYRANYIKINVDTTENGVFILSDAYYPGWKAYLDERQAKIYPAFGALRAVFLPKGKHELIFCYRPWTFFLGGVLTVLSVIFLGYIFFRIKTFK